MIFFSCFGYLHKTTDIVYYNRPESARESFPKSTVAKSERKAIHDQNNGKNAPCRPAYHGGGYVRGIECRFQFLRCPRPRRTSVPQRCRHLHGVRPARPVLRLLCRRCRRIPRRPLLLSRADVRLPRDARLAGGGDLSLLPLCAERASGDRLGTRRFGRCRHHGGRVFSRQSVYLQHAGVRRDQTAVSDSPGGSRCRPRDAANNYLQKKANRRGFIPRRLAFVDSEKIGGGRKKEEMPAVMPRRRTGRDTTEVRR